MAGTWGRDTMSALQTARSAQPPFHSRETRIDRVLALYNECIQVGPMCVT